MKILFLTIRIILATVFFGQQSFAMDARSSSALSLTFTQFSELLPDMQLMVFKQSNNKNNFQKTSKDWYVAGSIKSPTIFLNNSLCTDHSRMIRILLNAAYTGNSEGVNIFNINIGT